MCFMCDRPEATFGDYVEEVLRPVIDRFGWAVQAVGGTRVHVPFSYTVGLTLWGLPELVLTGKRPPDAAEVLNAYAFHLRHSEPPDPGRQVQVGERWFEVVGVPHPEAHLLVATGLFGEAEVTARQLVWHDERGRWPWDAGHRGGRGGQPVLGPRSPAPGAQREPRAG